MASELDELLTASRPVVAPRIDELRSALNAMVADAETTVTSRKRWGGRHLGIAGLVSAGVLGLGLTASATGLVQAPWWEDTSTPPYPGPSVHADQLKGGEDCRVVFTAAESEDPLHPVGKEERYRTLTFAKEFVRDFDISSISVPAAIDAYKAEYARDAKALGPPGEALPPSELLPPGSRDEVRVGAILTELGHILDQELKTKGMTLHAVSAMARIECRKYFNPAPDLP